MIVFAIVAVIVGFVLLFVVPLSMLGLTILTFALMGDARDRIEGWKYNLALGLFCVLMPLSGFLMDWGMGASGSRLFSGAQGLGVGALAVTLILASAYWGTRGVRLILALRGSAWCGR